MYQLSRLAVVVLAVFLLSACTSVKLGRDFDVGVFAAKVERGVTTAATVKTWLGEPSSTGVSMATDGERFDEWAYYFAEGQLPDMDNAKIKILQIRFDQQGKVRAFNWSASRQ